MYGVAEVGVDAKVLSRYRSRNGYREAAMKYVATRELRNRPGAFQDLLDGQDVVLTSSGKPFALVIGIDDENVEETVRLVRRVRAEQALSRLRKRAAEQGLDRLSDAEVEKEVRAARRARRRRG